MSKNKVERDADRAKARATAHSKPSRSAKPFTLRKRSHIMETPALPRRAHFSESILAPLVEEDPRSWSSPMPAPRRRRSPRSGRTRHFVVDTDAISRGPTPDRSDPDLLSGLPHANNHNAFPLYGLDLDGQHFRARDPEFPRRIRVRSDVLHQLKIQFAYCNPLVRTTALLLLINLIQSALVLLDADNVDFPRNPDETSTAARARSLWLCRRRWCATSSRS
jgi:hypothetical protein